MGPGDLVYINIVGERYVGIIESMDPALPEDCEREYNENDYCWVVVTTTGDRKWIKMSKLEFIYET